MQRRQRSEIPSQRLKLFTTLSAATLVTTGLSYMWYYSTGHQKSIAIDKIMNSTMPPLDSKLKYHVKRYEIDARIRKDVKNKNVAQRDGIHPRAVVIVGAPGVGSSTAVISALQNKVTRCGVY